MTRTKLLSILQEETDGFNEQSRLRDDVLDAMEEAYLKGKREQLDTTVVSKSVNCDHPRSERSYIGRNMLRCNKCGKEFS